MQFSCVTSITEVDQQIDNDGSVDASGAESIYDRHFSPFGLHDISSYPDLAYIALNFARAVGDRELDPSYDRSRLAEQATAMNRPVSRRREDGLLQK